MTQPPDEHYNQARRRAVALLQQLLLRQQPPVGWLPLDALHRSDNHTFVRLRGVQAVWEEDQQVALGERLLGTLRGLDGGAGCWQCWLIIYDAQREEIHLNLGAPYPDLARRVAQLHPYVQMEPADGVLIDRAARHPHQRIVAGVLSNRSTDQRYQPQLEQLLAVNVDVDWACWVHLAPAPHQHILQLQEPLLAAQEDLSPYAERTFTVGSGSGRRSSGMLQRTLAVLEQQIERLTEGLSNGLWISSIVLTATDERVDLLASSLLASYAAPGAAQPLIVHRGTGGRTTSDPRQVIGTEHITRELAGLVTTPRVERHGFRIMPFASFDQDVPSAPQHALQLGKIVQGLCDTGVSYRIGRDALVRHGLVAGLTGSGKSNTCKMLVKQITAGRTPVLIIEPAKAEYRSLKCRTYTLGNEGGAPLRLNPFELPTIDTPRYGRVFAPVQAHIDYLKAVFNASFILFAPMPYVLERCLHEIYVDRGWELATGSNPRVAHLDRIFPTLTDLYDKIDTVVATLGYDQRIEMDLRAGLLARVDSLRTGGRGLLLDAPRSTPAIGDLLAAPTVLELEALANDEEKSFVMGLLLALIYEYRMLQAAVERESGASSVLALRHLVLIEEAHRLLSQRHSAGGGDHADVGGQTLSVFANMLAEMRAYGQGFLIVDQIPGRLEPSIVKNTELKIIHKLVAPDDRQLLAQAANLSESQERYVSTLPIGHAVVHAGADDRPYLVHVAAFEGIPTAIATTTALLPPPLPSCPQHCPAWQRDRRCPLPLREIGRRIASRVEPHHVLGIVTATAEGQAYPLHQPMLRSIGDSAKHDAPEDAGVVRTCAILHAVEAGLRQFERAYPRWPIERTDDLVALCVAGPQPGDARPRALQLVIAQALTAAGPYTLCGELCEQRCRYHLFAERLTAPYRQMAGRGLGGDQAAAAVSGIAARQEIKLWGSGVAPASRRSFRTCLLIHLAQQFDRVSPHDTVLAAREALEQPT